MVFVRAAAGTWVSSEATVRDFATVAAPVLLLVVVAIVVERALKPTPERAAPPAHLYGAVPGLVYLNAAVFIVMRAGVPV